MEEDPQNTLVRSSGNQVDTSATGPALNYKNTQGSSQNSSINSIGKIFYKKVKIRKINKKLSQKPTALQTNELFDEVLCHLEKNNGTDPDLICCLRQIQ